MCFKEKKKEKRSGARPFYNLSLSLSLSAAEVLATMEERTAQLGEGGADKAQGCGA